MPRRKRKTAEQLFRERVLIRLVTQNHQLKDMLEEATDQEGQLDPHILKQLQEELQLDKLASLDPLLTRQPSVRHHTNSNWSLPFSLREPQASSGGEDIASQFNFQDDLHSRLMRKADTIELPSFLEAWESGINEIDVADGESDYPVELGELLNVDEKVLSSLLRNETWNRISFLQELGSPDQKTNDFAELRPLHPSALNLNSKERKREADGPSDEEFVPLSEYEVATDDLDRINFTFGSTTQMQPSESSSKSPHFSPAGSTRVT